MTWALATLALALLAFAAISGRIAGTPITSAMVFTGVGLLVGADALGLVELAPKGETVKLLAEATLTLVLFADASRIDVRALRESSASRPGCSGSACRSRSWPAFSLPSAFSGS